MSWWVFVPPWLVVIASTFLAYRRGYQAGFRAGFRAAMGGLEYIKSMGLVLQGMRALGFRFGERDEVE